MSNKEKFHKLSYDLGKSWTFSLVALLFVSIFGFYNPYVPDAFKEILFPVILLFFILFLITETWMIISFGILVKMYTGKKIKREKNTKLSVKQKKNSNWFKERFNVPRFFKAFLLSVIIGLGAYLGKIFFATHWLLALAFVTLFLMIFAGNLLDAVYPEH
ncbi:hypothetical protein CEE44_00070 [Candidatus Woesearchaeota archaeon B3_Woes]|nr:MAG: hypothetical protein CEE44_00070 [Candidatus Woesearchaeota archaeon B3_Woes]